MKHRIAMVAMLVVMALSMLPSATAEAERTDITQPQAQTLFIPAAYAGDYYEVVTVDEFGGSGITPVKRRIH